MTQEIITGAPVGGDAAKPPAAARPAWRCLRPTIAVVLTFGFGLLVLVAVSSVMWVALGTAQKNTLALVRQVADFSVAGLIDQIGYHLGSAQQQSEVLAAMMQRGEIDIDDRDRPAGALRGGRAPPAQVRGLPP